MRNLKRALSLTLASVMLLGMMVVGTSAKGYDDVDEKNNIEAIEVLQAIEVMVGDERGFGPDRPVNRAEMAVVMGLLLNLDYNYYASSCPFNDVYDWARGWVGACYANKIVSGRGEGIYDPGATVTAVEASSMLMRALGYFQYSNDFADGFELSTVRQGTKIGIFDGVGSSATEPMTRDQVAKMVLNALQSGMVEPDGNTINLTTPDGSVFTGKVNYVFRTSAKDFAKAISITQATAIGSQNGGPIVELGEQLYNGDLKLYDDRKDDFGRPSRTWEYKGEAIGTYMKKELLRQEWTVEVQGKDLYDLLGSDTIRDYSFDVTIDGVDIDGKTGSTEHNDVLKATGAGKAASYFDETYMARTYKSKVGQTGKGVLTQVFVNPDTKHVDVAVINTYLAKANADYSEKKDEVTLKVYALTSDGSGNSEVFYKYPSACKAPGEANQTKNIKITGDDFDIKDVKKDDIFLVTESNGEIKTLNDPEVLAAATLTAFSKDNYVVTDGTQYDYDTTVEYDAETLDDYTSISTIQTQQLKDLQYNVYLDPYGYVIGVKIVEAAKNYVFLTGIDRGTSNLKNKTAEAAGILTDGTFINFTMDLDDSKAYYLDNTGASGKYQHTDNAAKFITNGTEFTAGPLWNTWCTYTVDKDGVYTLTQVKQEANKTAKDKVGQYHDSVAFDPSVATPNATSKGKIINDKNVSLKGAADKWVYGNDKTVYIVPELKKVTAKDTVDAGYVRMPIDGSSNTANQAIAGGTDSVGIIGGVDSMGTGIANVDLVTWNAKKIADEINNGAYLNGYSGGTYALYNNDGYIVAAIVVGEDNGTSKVLAYSHKDSLSREDYSSADNEWTWERKVIINGEETTLTEKGSKLANSGLYYMNENVWYEVTYKANGTVKEAKEVQFSDYGKNIGKTPGDQALTLTVYTPPVDSADIAGNFVNDIEDIEYAINNNNKTNTLYEEVWGQGTDVGCTTDGNSKDSTNKDPMTKAPSLKDSTLYVDTENNKGFYVHDDVKTVLIQTNDGDTQTIYETGKPDLEAILDDLNFDGTTYLFKISAILTNGRASVVIIHDWNVTNATQSGERNPSTTGNHPNGLYVYEDNTTKGKLYYHDKKASIENDEAAANITQWLKDDGLEIVEGPKWNGSTNVYSWTTKNKYGVEKSWSWDATTDAAETSAVSVSADGTNYVFAGQITELMTMLGKGTTSANNIKVVDADGVIDFVDGTSTRAIAAGDKITTGYLKVVPQSGGTDVHTIVDVSNLETDHDATANSDQHYALPGTAIKKLGAATGTGLKVGAGTAYVAYTKTYGDVNTKDGNTSDGVATIAAANQVNFTIYDDSVAGAGAKSEVAVAYNASTADLNATIDSGSVGTMMYVGNKTGAAVVDSDPTVADADKTFYIGYVKVTASITGTPSAAWSVKISSTSDTTGKTITKDTTGAANLSFCAKNGDTITVAVSGATANIHVTGATTNAAAADTAAGSNVTDTAAATDVTVAIADP